jgi:predicted phage baseplate assembly protein
VLDPSGRSGTLDAALNNFTLVPSSKKDAVIQEFALVSSISLQKHPYPHTRIHLASELLNCYDRTATTVNANVGLATQGMSVSEILGSGSASTPNQKFSLKQKPLTFVQAPTSTGRLSTLEATANGVVWSEVPSLYQQAPAGRVFATLNQPGGNTDTLFGDGLEGSTLPTGQNNVWANYRIGSGLSGNVPAASITTLVDRPLGVSGVNNPQGATGGQDAQSVDDIRTNAPLSVLTLGRAVSITDYQNFAQGFAGIAKAYAIWIPSGPGRGLFITVAAAGGSALPPGNPALDYLVTALQSCGNPLIPIHVQSFLETLFGLSAEIKYDPAYDAKAVKQRVLDQLRQSYSFTARTFGQGVSADEIAAVIQNVPGVIACNVTSLKLGQTSKAGDLSSAGWSTYAYQQWLMQPVPLVRPGSGSPTRICAYLPVASPDKLPDPAEILVLDPNPKNVALGVLS